MGYTNSNLTSGSLYGKVLYQLADTAGPALRGGSAKEQSNDISHKLLQKVQRENEIKTETFTKLVAYTGSLSVTVTNSSGANLQGAQVQAYQNGSPVGAAAATDATGTAVISGLAAGAYTVRATYFSISDDSSTVTVQKDQTTPVPPIALAVVGGKALIHVLDSAGAGVGGATVAAEAASGLHGAADKSLFDRILGVKTAYAAAGFKVTAVTDASGIARFDNLPPGNYKFTVTNNGKEMKSLSVSVANDSTSSSTVVLPASGGNIVAMIIDEVSKAAIDGATVELKSGSTVIETKTTDSDGTAVFSGLTAGSTYTVTASAANYSGGSVNTTVTDKETVAAAIALTPLQQIGSATITVKGNDNQPIKGATVSVTVNGQVQNVTTDAEGKAAFASMPTGKYTFKAMKAGYSEATSAEVSITADTPATSTITMTRQIVNVTIAVIDYEDNQPIGEAKVTVTLNGETISTTNTTSDGKAIFENLTTGYYNFTVTKVGYSKSSLGTTINDTTTETIELIRPKNQITITVNGPDGKPIEGVDVTTMVEIGDEIKPVTKTTNASGIAKFTELPTAKYTFTATKAGYDSQTTNVTVYGGEPVGAGTITLTPKIITAQVNVKDGAGQNVWGASVRVTGNGVDQTKQTNSSGNVEPFSLPAGTYTFTATCNNYNDDSETISISEEDISVNLTIVHKVGDLTFIVKDSNGQPISGAEISESYSEPKNVLGHTGLDGKLELTNVPTNVNTQMHWFSVSKDGYQGIIQGVTVSEGKNEQEIVLKSFTG